MVGNWTQRPDLKSLSLSHDVREPMCGGDMEDMDLPQSNADEVNVNLDVLRATMMNWIGCHVDCTNVVAIDNSHQRNRDMKLLNQLSQLAALSNCPILCLCTRTGRCSLPL